MTRGVDHVEHRDVVTSTQAAAHAWLDAGAAAGSIGLFSTDHQTAGAGRAGRSWIDAPGTAALLSVAVAGPCPTDVLLDLAPRVCRAVAAELTRLTSVDVSWRAPNDLYVGDRKLGGVLVDARTVADEVERLVVGVGVNVVGPDFDVAGRGATTLAAAGAAIEVALVRAAIVRAVCSVVS